MKKAGETCWIAPRSARCWAVSSSDTAPILIALGAKALLAGPKGERYIPLEHLFQDDGMDYLQKASDEILVELKLPDSAGVKMSYLKLRRRAAIDFPILGVAVALRLDEDGACTDARIVLGAIASRPIRAYAAESSLLGHQFTRDAIEEAARLAYRPAKPLDNTDMTPSYRKRMVPVLVARALEGAVEGVAH